MNADTVIRVNELSISYNNTLILQDINCEIKSGEFIGILGRSGSGKTTFLNAIAGFIKHTGTIDIYGSIGFCFQQNSLFHWMTVSENISFGLNGIDKKEKKKIVLALLKDIDLEYAADKYPFELSGGQIQRVSFARALASKPAIILLDEPFSALDVLTRDLMIDWVLDFIKGYNVTVIMVTHYIDEALIFSDRIFILKNKKIEQELKVEFPTPRTQEIKFTDSFQKNKQFLLTTLKN